MKKSFLTYILMLLTIVSMKIYAQEEFIESPSRCLTRIPFTQLTGGIVIIQALLDNYPDTLNFILDSGSSGISLDSTTVEYLKIHPIPSNRTIRGIAGIRKVSFIYNRKLHFPGFTIDSLDFHVNDYDILTEVYGERIDGIIGYSVLSRYIIKIDYDSLKIDICSKGSLRYPKGGYLLKPTISTLAAQNVRVKDAVTVNSKFLYDIGAGACMMLSSDFVNNNSLLGKRRKLFPKEGEGIGGKIKMYATVIKEVKLGPFRFRQVPIYIFDDVYNVTSYPYLGGLLGNDLLRRFNTILNYDKKDIYLIPNSHYYEPFDYSYSGLEFDLVNGAIIVGDVAKGSPADKAGVKENDIVVGVNRNFSQNLNQYKISLQTANQWIKLIIRRDGHLQEIFFKIKSIL